MTGIITKPVEGRLRMFPSSTESEELIYNEHNRCYCYWLFEGISNFMFIVLKCFLMNVLSSESRKSLLSNRL